MYKHKHINTQWQKKQQQELQLKSIVYFLSHNKRITKHKKKIASDKH